MVNLARTGVASGLVAAVLALTPAYTSQYARADEKVSKPTPEAKKDWRALNEEAMKYAIAKDYANAVAGLEKAIEADPTRFLPRYNLAATHRAWGESLLDNTVPEDDQQGTNLLEKSIPEYGTAIDVLEASKKKVGETKYKQDAGLAYSARGRTYLRLGKKAEAQNDLRKSLEFREDDNTRQLMMSISQ